MEKSSYFKISHWENPSEECPAAWVWAESNCSQIANQDWSLYQGWESSGCNDLAGTSRTQFYKEVYTSRRFKRLTKSLVKERIFFKSSMLPSEHSWHSWLVNPLWGQHTHGQMFSWILFSTNLDVMFPTLAAVINKTSIAIVKCTVRDKSLPPLRKKCLCVDLGKSKHI